MSRIKAIVEKILETYKNNDSNMNSMDNTELIRHLETEIASSWNPIKRMQLKIKQLDEYSKQLEGMLRVERNRSDKRVAEILSQSDMDNIELDEVYLKHLESKYFKNPEFFGLIRKPE